MPYIKRSAYNKLEKITSNIEQNRDGIRQLILDIKHAETVLKNRYPFKNLLINGDMSIWQRGFDNTVSLSDGYFGADRYFTWSGSLTGACITGARHQRLQYTGSEFRGYVYRLEVTNVDTTKAQRRMRLVQRLDNYFWPLLLAKEVVDLSISFWIRMPRTKFILQGLVKDDSVAPLVFNRIFTVTPNEWTRIETSVRLYPDDMNRLPVDWSKFSFFEIFNVEIGYTADNVELQVGDYIELAYVQVEFGDRATSFEKRHPTVELKLCQHYYYSSLYPHFDVTNLSGAWTFRALDSSLSTETFFILPVPMNRIPSVQYIAYSSGSVGYTRDRTDNVDTPICVGSETSQNLLFFSGCGNFISGHLYSHHFTADAEVY